MFYSYKPYLHLALSRECIITFNENGVYIAKTPEEEKLLREYTKNTRNSYNIIEAGGELGHEDLTRLHEEREVKLIAEAEQRKKARAKEGGKVLPDIPITELFSYQEFPMERVALRWYSSKTTMEMLGIKERQLRRYAEDGRLEKKYKTVKGRRRVYYSNISVLELLRYLSDRRTPSETEDNAEEGTDAIDRCINTFFQQLKELVNEEM